MGREVAECCVDGMVAELVSAFSTRFYVTNLEIAAGRIYAIGFQVGQKLSERFFCAAHKSIMHPWLHEREAKWNCSWLDGMDSNTECGY